MFNALSLAPLLCTLHTQSFQKVFFFLKRAPSINFILRVANFFFLLSHTSFFLSSLDYAFLTSDAASPFFSHNFLFLPPPPPPSPPPPPKKENFLPPLFLSPRLLLKVDRAIYFFPFLSPPPPPLKGGGGAGYIIQQRRHPTDHSFCNFNLATGPAVKEWGRRAERERERERK